MLPFELHFSNGSGDLILTAHYLNPYCVIFRKQQLQAQEKAKRLLKSLGITQDIKLTKYEMIIASNLVS